MLNSMILITTGENEEGEEREENPYAVGSRKDSLTQKIEEWVAAGGRDGGVGDGDGEGEEREEKVDRWGKFILRGGRPEDKATASKDTNTGAIHRDSPAPILPSLDQHYYNHYHHHPYRHHHHRHHRRYNHYHRYHHNSHHTTSVTIHTPQCNPESSQSTPSLQ
jgi:hypothetical protein